MKWVIDHSPNPLLGNEDVDRPAFCSAFNPWSFSATENAELTITLRILFEQVNRFSHGIKFPDSDGKLFEICNWTPYYWDKFKADALILANKIWNNQLWLLSPPGFKPLYWPSAPQKATHRANVKCSLNVIEAMYPGEAHAKVRVARLFESAHGKFRSDMTTWCSDDCSEEVHKDPTNYGAGGKVRFYTVPHEVGHLLGLHHIGEQMGVGTCKIKGGCTVKDDYAVNPQAALWMAHNVMGIGTWVNSANAGPWIKRMAAHTDGKTSPADWKAVTWNEPAKRIVA